MVWMLDDKMPHAELFFYSKRPVPEKMNKENIGHIYEELITACKGMIDFIYIVDWIWERMCFPEKVIIAALFITVSLDGYMTNGEHCERVKYMRINGQDMVISLYDYRVFAGKELSGFEFYGNKGEYYRLATNMQKRPKFNVGSSHANDRSPEDE